MCVQDLGQSEGTSGDPQEESSTCHKSYLSPTNMVRLPLPGGNGNICSSCGAGPPAERATSA